MRTWLITGASRGLGRELVLSALRSGAQVVATGRKLEDLADAFGPGDDRLALQVLDVADRDQAQAAVDAALARFGGIDVLVNNAGFGNLSVFEELTSDDARSQFDTNVFGIFNVCWAALPAMRAVRRGHIFNISSIAGIRGGQGGAVYSASKHAVEGFSESLAVEVRDFGIKVTIVEPGFFRTEFFSEQSLQHGSRPIDDYAEVSASRREYQAANHHQQPGDPAKLADVIVGLANEAEPPLRFAAGTDAIAAIEGKAASLLQELEAWKVLSSCTDFRAG